MTDNTPSHQRNHWAIMLKIISFVLYGWNDVLCKKLTTNTALLIQPHSIVCYQYFFAACFLLPFYLLQSAVAKPRQHLPLHLLRAVLCATGILLLNQSFSVMPLSYAVGFNLFSPILSFSVAILWFKEKITTQKILALGISILAYLLLINANFQQPQAAMTLQNCLKPSIALLCFQLNTLVTKKLTQQRESNVNLTLYLFALITCAMLPLEAQHPLTWSPSILITIALMGALTTMATLALHQAIKLVDVTFLIPFGFVKYAIIAFLGYFYFLEIPNFTHLTGIALTVLTLVILAKNNSLPSTSQTSLRQT